MDAGTYVNKKIYQLIYLSITGEYNWRENRILIRYWLNRKTCKQSEAFSSYCRSYFRLYWRKYESKHL